jgi:glycogen(starch) synthase
MKIAFITFEYPPDTAYGGIATYVNQAAIMLQSRGHQVEVFTSSPYRSGDEWESGVLVHRIRVAGQRDFSKPIGQVFAKRHAQIQFDVLEGPEFCADAREAVRLVPEVPFVVKLHTPSILLYNLNFRSTYSFSFTTKVRLYIRGWLKGSRPRWGSDPNLELHRQRTMQTNEMERLHTLDADEIASPSTELAKLLEEEWNLNPAMISHVPYPYQPSEDLLKIPVETCTNVVTFLGRLEVRKGVLDLAKAIPLVLDRCPQAKFRFVGPSDVSPEPGISMEHHLKRTLRRFSKKVEFTGGVPIGEIPGVLAATDVCVFPSVWENFPCVCLEAMAAARGIVASNAGGMVGMLDSGRLGRLHPPFSPKRIAETVIELVENPALRMELGQAARTHLLAAYNLERIGALQEASYAQAIARRKAIGGPLVTA